MPTTAFVDALETDGLPLMLPGGRALVATGELATSLYRLTAGRLAEVETVSDHGDRLIAVHRPGAVIGAAQILTGAAFRTTITALRDSELVAIPAERAAELMSEQPHFLAEVARLALTTGLGGAEPADLRRSSILGFVAVCDDVVMRDMAEDLARAMRRLGARVKVLGADSADFPPERLSALEAAHDFVLMAAERRDERFTSFCGRQIDRLALVGGAETPLPDAPFEFAAAAIQHHRLVDFVLRHPANALAPAASDRWLSASSAARLFHVREGNDDDFARLARVYTGRSVGLALSGGGARAYAHVGVARALGELRVPIDFVAGTSMGARWSPPAWPWAGMWRRSGGGSRKPLSSQARSPISTGRCWP
jgi:NTE family protein